MDGLTEALPSTLAANLVNNLSGVRKPPRKDEQELRKLLLEVSENEEAVDGASSTEAVIEHHYKLIYAVTSLALEELTTDDPFADEEQLLEQASDGLDALIGAIKETPAVLAHTASDRIEFRSASKFPLWIWLFPRLLALVGMERCQVLQLKIRALFMVAFATVPKSQQLWSLNSALFCYLQRCAGGKRYKTRH